MKLLLFFIACGIIQYITCLNLDNVRLNEEDANDFLNNGRPAIQKRFLYTAKEQRREAKENYEEKCERSSFSKLLGKPRWCPELTLWPEWLEFTKNDGNGNLNKIII